MNRGKNNGMAVSMPTDTVWMTMQLPTCTMCSAAMCSSCIQGPPQCVRKNDRISYDVYSLELVIAVAFR